LELGEKKSLYKFTKSVLIISGVFLVSIGGWYLGNGVIGSGHSTSFWFALLPAYVGSMLILISVAMRIEWFTDARSFW